MGGLGLQEEGQQENRDCTIQVFDECVESDISRQWYKPSTRQLCREQRKMARKGEDACVCVCIYRAALCRQKGLR